MNVIEKVPEYLPSVIYVKDWINLAAIIIGPIMAIQVQKWLEKRNSDKDRRVAIFKTLMATRGAVLSLAHVEALNRIDLEFSAPGFTKVTAAWKEYFDNLNVRVETKEEIAVWNGANNELLANLLLEMSNSLGYEFEKALIKRNWYSPLAHGNIENENEMLRNGMIQVLEGTRSLPIQISGFTQDEEELNEQKALRKLMINYYTPKGGVLGK